MSTKHAWVILVVSILYALQCSATLLNVTMFQPRPTSMTPSTQDQLNLLDEAARNASLQGSQLLVLPELYLSGYNYNLLDIYAVAEVSNGPSFQQAQQIAIKYNISILYTYPELACSECKGVYDTAALIYRDGTTLTQYRKVNLAPGENEFFGLTPGDGFAPIVEVDGVFIGIAICYDSWFPEVFRVLGLSSAQLILVPTANGYPPGTNVVSEIIIPSRALENSAITIYNNWAQNVTDAYGGFFQYWGQSIIYNYAEYEPVYYASPYDQVLFTTTLNFPSPFSGGTGINRRAPNFVNNSLCYNVTTVTQPIPGYVGTIPAPVNTDAVLPPQCSPCNSDDCDGKVSAVNVLLPCVICSFVAGLALGYAIFYFWSNPEKATTLASKSISTANSA